mgnify:CR=1 FL=1
MRYTQQTASILILIGCLAITTTAAQFSVSKGVRGLAENMTAPTMEVVSGPNLLSFIPPDNSLPAIRPSEHKIEFTGKDGKYSCSIKIGEGSVPDPDEILRQVGKSYPGAKTTAVVTAIVASGNGLSVDVMRTFSNGAHMTTRHVYCPCNEQFIEVIFTAETSLFRKEQKQILGPMFTSFKITQAGSSGPSRVIP